MELICLVTAIVSFFSGVALIKNGLATPTLLFIVTVLAAYGVYVGDKKHKQLTKPAPIVLPEYLPLPIRIYVKPKRAVLMLLGAFFFLGPVYPMYLDGYEVIGIVAVPLGLLFLFAAYDDLTKIREPFIALDSLGIKVRPYGFIPWEEIRRADTTTIHSTAGARHFRMLLEIANPEKYVRRLPVLYRFMRYLQSRTERNDLVFSLDFLDTNPRYIEALIARLWSEHATTSDAKSVTGNLSIDRRFTEIERLMTEAQSSKDAAVLERNARRIDELIRENQQEFSARRKALRNEIFYGILAMLVFFAGLALLQFLVH